MSEERNSWNWWDKKDRGPGTLRFGLDVNYQFAAESISYNHCKRQCS